MRITALAVGIALATTAAASLMGTAGATPDVSYDQSVHQIGTPTAALQSGADKALLEKALGEGDGAAALQLAALALKALPEQGDGAYLASLAYLDRAVQLQVPEAVAQRALTVTKRGYYQGRETEAGQATLGDARVLLDSASAADPSNTELRYQLGLLQVNGLGGDQVLVGGYDNILASADAGNGRAALWIADRFAGAQPRAPLLERKYLTIASRAKVSGAAARLSALDSGQDSIMQLGSASSDLVVSATVASATGSATTQVPASMAIPAAAFPSPIEESAVALVESAAVRPDAALAQAQAQLEAARQRIAQLQAELERVRAASGVPSDADLARWNQEGIQAVLEGNYELAANRFREASRYEYVPALGNLAVLYMNSSGVPRDLRQAAALFERAAKAGNVVAAENLGRGYEFGLLGRDRSRAIRWYEVAAGLGSDQAAAALARLKAGN